MSVNWFECKVKYIKIDENGKTTKVREPYLIDAVSFTEAEARIHAVLEKYIHGDFMVTNISRANLADIFMYDDGQKWYKCKVAIVDVDEETGRAKNANQMMLIAADDPRQAFERIEESLGTLLVPYEIKSVAESPIVDVFPYFTDEKNKEIPSNLKPLESNNSKFTAVSHQDDDLTDEDEFLDEEPEDEIPELPDEPEI